MKDYKEHKHLGAYGIVINDNEEILLIKKAAGPYTGRFDLPGGSFEFGERPCNALKRELMEEVGIEVIDYELITVDSVLVDWFESEENYFKVHHTGIFYKVNEYKNDILNDVELDDKNNDSLGADFYKIKDLSINNASEIVMLILEYLNLK